MVNLNNVIQRLKKLKGYQRDKQLAEMFDLSAPDFSRRKKRGTLLPLIVEWSLKNSINLDWLMTGQTTPCVSDNNGRYTPLDAGLLRSIIEAVLAGLKQMNQELDAAKTADIIVLLYESHSGSDKKVTSETVAKYLRVAI